MGANIFNQNTMKKNEKSKNWISKELFESTTQRVKLTPSYNSIPKLA